MATTYKVANRVPDTLTGTSQLRETTPTQNIGAAGSLGTGYGANNTTLEKKKAMKSKKATAGTIY
jgi:hypothetical protein